MGRGGGVHTITWSNIITMANSQLGLESVLIADFGAVVSKLPAVC